MASHNDDTTTFSTLHVDVSQTKLRSRHRIPQKVISPAEFLARPVLIRSFDPSLTTHSPFALYDAWRTNADVANFLSQYALVRGNTKLTITYSGSSSLYGGARVFCVPSLYNVVSTYGPPPIYLMATIDPTLPEYCPVSHSLPHADLDYTQSSQHDLILPFIRCDDFYRTQYNDSDWVMRSHPLSGPFTTSGLAAPTLTVNVYMSLIDAEVDIIIPQSGSVDAATPGLFEKMLRYSQFVSRLIGNFATYAEKASKMGADLAQRYGYSKSPDSMVANVYMTGTNIASTSGVAENSLSVALDPGVAVDAMTPYPMTNSEELTVGGLASKWGHLSTDWVEYESYPVTPTTLFPYNVLGVDYYYLTPLNFISAVFRHWTGDIEFKVIVRSSPLLRWRILIVIVPPGVSVPLTPPTSGFQMHVVDILGTTEFDFIVPYFHKRPFTAMDLNMGDGEAPNATNPKLFYDYNAATSSDTRIVWYPLMSVLGPAPGVTAPKVELYHRAGPGFALKEPTLQNINRYAVIEQSGVMIANGKAAIEHTGEVVDSLYTLMKRTCAYWDAIFNNGLALGGRFIFPLGGVMPGVTGVVYDNALTYLVEWSFYTYLSSAFLWERGGTIQRLNQPRTDNAEFWYGFVTQVSGNGLASMDDVFTNVSNPYGEGAVTGTTRQNGVISMRVNDKDAFRFRYARKQTRVSVNSYLRGFWQADTRLNTRVLNLHAVDEDYMMGGYLCAPILRRKLLPT